MLLARILRAMPADSLSSRPPVRPALRTFITALLVFGVVVPSIIIRELIEGVMGSGPFADLGWIAVPMAATAWLAPRASYRRRDALWWLAGGFGLYIFVVIAWRVAFLPYRDWPPRPDEASRIRWPRDRQQAGLWYLSGDVSEEGRGSRRSPEMEGSLSDDLIAGKHRHDGFDAGFQ